ncbi:hypothetical protein [Haloferax sp. KTX1]|uniref:hypothetical protein n=1 Tax=Haloferax sp. KTX1 TaxID=2600597 RepID=UPI00165271AE|nr:hypothetical protein [Haloferax sp. KTX1]
MTTTSGRAFIAVRVHGGGTKMTLLTLSASATAGERISAASDTVESMESVFIAG